MKIKILLVLIPFLLMNFIVAQSFCVDFDKPSAPSNLILTKVSNGIQLIWNPATDVPACSGISHYDIYRGFNGGSLSLVGNSSTTSFLDNITPQVGTYTYIVHAWDLVGHNEGNGVSKSINIEASGGTTPPSGGGGGGTSTINTNAGTVECFEKWQCSDWSECASPGVQTRICTDLNSCGTTLNKPAESQDCMLTEKTTSTGFLGPTGAAIGNFVKSGGGIATILVLTTIVVLSIAITSMKKKKLTKEQKTKEF